MGQKIAFLLGLCIFLGFTISGATALDTPYSLSGHVYDNGSNPLVGVNISFTNLNSSEIIYCDSTVGGEYQQDAANFASGYWNGDNIQYYSVYGVYTNTTTALINTANGGTVLDIYLSSPPPTQPLISSPSAGSITATTTQISWSVNQTTNNIVRYGKNANLSDGTWSGWQNGTSSPNIALGSLETDTTYYYQVWSYNIYNDSFYASYPVSSPYAIFSTLSSNLMSSVEWLNSITDLFSLFGILIIVAITSLIIYILVSKESLGSDLLIAMMKTLIIVGVILFIGVVIFMQLGDL